MKITRYHILMGICVFLQAALGLTFVIAGWYMEEVFYGVIPGFFQHFIMVPGVVMLLCLFHFLGFRGYDKKVYFATASGFIAFVLANTGECMVLFYNMFPHGWLGWVIWFVLAAAITALVVLGLNFLFIINYTLLQRKKSVNK